MLVLILILSAGGIGWFVGNFWIQSQRQSDDVDQFPSEEDFKDPVVSPNDDTEPDASSEFSAEEQQRKQALRQHRTNLGIDYNVYVSLVDEAFWNQYPERRGQQLGAGSEDARFREEWDAIADDFLTRIEALELSRAARQQLGSYKEDDLTRWKNQANRLRVSSRALYDVADAKFFHHFPKQQGEDFLNQPIGQVWQGIVGDTVKALQSRRALDRIVFAPETTGKLINGTLQPGGGQIFTAELISGQLMNVKLSPDEDILFSIYSPTGQVALLEDSRDRAWSGELPESGVYEFVIVSQLSEPIDYQLDLTVEDEPSSEPLPEEDGIE
ncbi:hypothetical protein IQ258_18520 [Coleofasciculus sp. LEGE 07081]|nr:hypothetical protein [Coleofasciculus sp. LEGE 07081]